MVSETDLRKRIQMALVYQGVILHRNNCGQLKNDRGKWVRYGVGNPGGSDLIGWYPIVVTPEMVSHRVAVFSAIEVKGPGGRLTKEQDNFIRAVVKAGGVAFDARSVMEAQSKLGQWSIIKT